MTEPTDRQHQIERARERLEKAAIVVADVLDAGERDPTWHEAQELEEAAIQYGRARREVQRARAM